MTTPQKRRTFVMQPCAQAALIAVGMLTLQAAQAQQSAEPARLERVEITGSSIKRIDAETALPVQILKREDIIKSGATTATELLTKISANTAAVTDGVSFTDVGAQRGFNGANLRGIGTSSTLVLLNGRRIANYALPGSNSGVDLNAIPVSALDRVEVLKDGASAIYGADAIGGVINFITRRDYTGLDFAASTYITQHGGAGKSTATLSGGIGNITTDRYNLMATLDIQDLKPLRSKQREFARTAFRPDEGVDFTSSNTFPANIDGPNGRVNPTAPACNPPFTLPSGGSNKYCFYDYQQDTEIYPEAKKIGITARGEFALTPDHTLFAEMLIANNETTYRISPGTARLTYPSAGKYYPTGLGLSGNLRIRWRTEAGGNRTNQVSSDNQRLVFGAKGLLGGWDYDAAVSHSVNHVVDNYVQGYFSDSLLRTVFATGDINPFGASDAAGTALLQSAKISDKARDSTGKTTSIDGKLSKEIFNLPAGAVSLAVGGEARREQMDFQPSALFASEGIFNEGTATALKGTRNVKAAFAEVNIPVLKNLEAQLAARHDRYSDFGGTTNPKVGMRWQPVKQVIVRGSYGQGFRAPTLPDLYDAQRTGQTSGLYLDTKRCVNGVPAPGADATDCIKDQFATVTGGNPKLKPEKSKQLSLGVAVEPVTGVTMTADYWKIRKTDVIGNIGEGTVFDNLGRYDPQFVTRGPADPLFPNTPGRITSITLLSDNLGKLNTSGIDVGVDWRGAPTAYGRFGVSAQGTYVMSYEKQAEPTGSPINNVGVYVNDQAVQRWRHTISFNWDQGPFGATLSQTFLLGYTDQNLNLAGEQRRVGNYELWDLSGSYRPTQALTLRAAMRNLFDRNPPFSNQAFSYLATYDASYADPRGRALSLSLSYAFK